jgi:hypothetical protein
VRPLGMRSGGSSAAIAAARQRTQRRRHVRYCDSGGAVGYTIPHR